MRLISKDTQAPAEVGDIIFKDNEKWRIAWAPRPSSPASEGKVTCVNIEDNLRVERTYYASVWGLEWIEREDRPANDGE